MDNMPCHMAPDSDSEEFNDAEYMEFLNALPTFQDFFRSLSNRKIVEAARLMGIFHGKNRKKAVARFRKVLNLFRTICGSRKARRFHEDFISFGYGPMGKENPIFLRKRRGGGETKRYYFWVEYFHNSLPALVTEKIDPEDYPSAELAAAITDFLIERRADELNTYWESYRK